MGKEFSKEFIRQTLMWLNGRTTSQSGKTLMALQFLLQWKRFSKIWAKVTVKLMKFVGKRVGKFTSIGF